MGKTTVVEAVQHNLVVTAVGTDKPGIAHAITEMAAHTGGRLVFCRMSTLGTIFSATLMISGNWGIIARLESAIPILEKQYGVVAHLRRTSIELPEEPTIPYLVQVIAPDNAAVVSDTLGFFAKEDINILEVYTDTYQARQTGADMLLMVMTLSVPSDVSVASLREGFGEFCDSINVDGILEPEKN